MFVETAAAADGVWVLQPLAHRAILRGLRAPRQAHSRAPDAQGLASDRVPAVRIPGPRGRQLFGWLVMPPLAAEQPAPAVLVMHGWGANAAMMWPVVPPLHAAGLAWLRAQPDIAGERLAVLSHSVGAAAALLHASRHDDVRAVISLSAFVHPREVMRRYMAERRGPYPVLGWYMTVRRVSMAAIERGWDELLRLAASIRSGRFSATLALQRFGSAAQGDPLHRAAEHLGRLLRTVFLCDCIAIDDARREIHTLLDRGKSVHQLQRAVHSGKVAPECGRRREEMRVTSGSHALLTNIVLGWNTSRMHEVVERLKRDGIPVEDDWLRRIGPAHFSHINFRGTMRFGVERFGAALIQRVPVQATAVAS